MLAQIGAFALPALLPDYITRWNLSKNHHRACRSPSAEDHRWISPHTTVSRTHIRLRTKQTTGPTGRLLAVDRNCTSSSGPLRVPVPSLSPASDFGSSSPEGR